MAGTLSRLRPDSATMVGLLTAAGVFLIYNNALPSAADIRAAMPDNAQVESERKKAAWESVGLIAVVFLVSRDLNSYMISGAALVGIDLMYKHSNAVHPNSNQVEASSSNSIAPTSEAYSMPDYQESM
jgi:hypothetical protein